MSPMNFGEEWSQHCSSKLYSTVEWRKAMDGKMMVRILFSLFFYVVFFFSFSFSSGILYWIGTYNCSWAIITRWAASIISLMWLLLGYSHFNNSIILMHWGLVWFWRNVSGSSGMGSLLCCHCILVIALFNISAQYTSKKLENLEWFYSTMRVEC